MNVRFEEKLTNRCNALTVFNFGELCSRPQIGSNHNGNFFDCNDDWKYFFLFKQVQNGEHTRVMRNRKVEIARK